METVKTSSDRIRKPSTHILSIWSTNQSNEIEHPPLDLSFVQHEDEADGFEASCGQLSVNLDGQSAMPPRWWGLRRPKLRHVCVECQTDRAGQDSQEAAQFGGK